MTDNSNSANQFEEKNEQALNDIKQLQQYEQKLYTDLENPNLTTEEKQVIIMKINELSQMRMNLYGMIKNMYSNYETNVSTSESTLDQQMVAIDVLEEELNRTKLRLNALDAEKVNKLRVVEINDYYGKRYQAHKQVVFTLFILCIPVIILAALANAGVLPPKLYSVLVTIIIVFGFVRIGYLLIDMSNRSNMNWDEYVWRFDKSKAPSDTTDASSKTNPWTTKTISCVGAECCLEGDTYDETLNKCVPPNSQQGQEQGQEQQQQESFTAMAKYAYPSDNTTYITSGQTNKPKPSFGGVMSTNIFASV